LVWVAGLAVIVTVFGAAVTVFVGLDPPQPLTASIAASAPRAWVLLGRGIIEDLQGRVGIRTGPARPRQCRTAAR
jgi:hypothetical protein